MGQAKHKRSRCNCRRFGTRHEDGCAALVPPVHLETFVIGVEKELANRITALLARESKRFSSAGELVVALIGTGLEIAEAVYEKESLVKLPTSDQIAGIVLGGR